MINELSISALGVIENTSVEFAGGLTVLTGETGAGKTMVLTAVELLLGARADAGKIRPGESQATIDAVFTLEREARRNLVEEEQLGELLGEENEIVVSRTLTPTRSRAHLNHRPVAVTTLHTLAPALATIHGQADQLALRSPARQLQFLDEYGGQALADIKSRYQQAWAEAVAAKRKLDKFLENRDQAQMHYDALAPVIASVDELQLEPGEEDSLAQEAERITNVEQLRTALATSYRLLAQDGEGACDALGSAAREIGRASETDRELTNLATRANQISVETQALAEDVREQLENLSADPARLEWINQRLQAIRTLLRGRALDVAGLLEWTETKRAELADLEASDERYDELSFDLTKAQQQVLSIGQELRRARQSAAAKLGQAVSRELSELAMKTAQFKVDLEAKPKPGPDGLDTVTMTLQPHADAAPVPLGAGASGGELSRVMLALEVTVAQNADSRPDPGAGATYIFDEIDAGIGGTTALAVGQRLARLAKGRQVIVVTHLPQVAAWADRHLVISKTGATTSVEAVSGSRREEELARMLSGSPQSRTARAHAAELLQQIKVAQSEA
ncbi:MAG: DNA repair protein RecN [Actinomycetaceae bacterium]|nr:DNA repair protein RecN [Actinomycetaceae bacterium]